MSLSVVLCAIQIIQIARDVSWTLHNLILLVVLSRKLLLCEKKIYFKDLPTYLRSETWDIKFYISLLVNLKYYNLFGKFYNFIKKCIA